MQQGGTQSGGFDPALAALIASILTGGIGSYGYSKTNENALENAKNSMDNDQKRILAAAESALASKTDEARKNANASGLLAELKAERDALKKQVDDLKSKMTSASGPALTFKTATPEALKAAIPKVLETLGARYPHLTTKEGTSKIIAALEYPTTYQAKLEGLTLPMFYTKRLQIVFQQIANAANKKGGRRYRRRQRGGKDATDMELAEYDSSFTSVQNDSKDPAARARLAAARKVILGRDDAAQIVGPKEPNYPLVSADKQAAFNAVSGADPDYDALSAFSAPPPEPAAAVVPAVPGAKGIPSYDEFAAIYEDAIRNSTVSAKDAVDKRSADAKKKVDDKLQAKKDSASSKLAGVMGLKLNNTVVRAGEDIAKQESIVSILAPARRETLQKTKTALQSKFAQAIAVAEQLRTVKTEVDWLEKQGAAQTLYEAIPKDAKAYVEEVKKAKKEEEKSMTDTGKRDLFKISFTMSVGNPFNALWSALNDPSKAYTESQKASKFREESGKVVEFIRKIYDSVPPTLKELESFKKRRKGGRRRRGGAMDTASAEDKCATKIKTDARYTSGDPGFLIDSLRAITTGGREPIDGTEWVPRKVTDSAKKSTLKYLLDRLNTGALASASDYLRGAMGKDAQYTPEDAALAGEAYVLLRCYLEKAAEVVKTFKGSETVIQNLQNNRAAAAELAAASAAAKSQSEDNLDNARQAAKITIANAEKELTDREAKIRDVFAAVSMEIGRRPRRIADTGALEGVQADLLKAQKALSTFRTSEIHQKFMSSADIFEGVSTVDVAPLQSEFDSRATIHKGEADGVYAIVDESLDDAGMVARSYASVAPDFAKKVGDLTGVAVASSIDARPFDVANPMFARPADAGIEMTRLPSRPSAPSMTPPVSEPVTPAGTGDPNSGRTTPRSEGADTPIDLSSKAVADLEAMQKGLETEYKELSAVAYGPDRRWAYRPGQSAKKDAAVEKSRVLDAQINAIEAELKTRPEYIQAQLEKKRATVAALEGQLQTIRDEKAALSREGEGVDADGSMAGKVQAIDISRRMSYANTREGGIQAQIKSLQDAIAEASVGPPPAPLTAEEFASLSASQTAPAAAPQTPLTGPEALAAGLPPSQAVSGDVLRPNQPSVGLSRQNSKFFKGGKKTRRKGRKGGRKSRKSTLKKRRGGK